MFEDEDDYFKDDYLDEEGIETSMFEDEDDYFEDDYLDDAE